MEGTVGLVAFCVLSAGFLVLCFAIFFGARDVKCELELLDWRSSRARRRILRGGRWPWCAA